MKSFKDDTLQQGWGIYDSKQDNDWVEEESLEAWAANTEDGEDGEDGGYGEMNEEELLVAQVLLSQEEQAEDGKQTPKGRQSREKTLSRRALARMFREKGRVPEETVLWMEALRPTLRSQCRGSARPCPHVSCRYHLYLDVNPETGSIKLNFPNIEVWEMKESCALDIAERGGVTLEEVGQLMNLTRERIRQLESHGLSQVKRIIAERELTEDLEDFETDKH